MARLPSRILQEGDPRCAVGIVLDCGYFCRNVQLAVTFEIDQTVDDACGGYVLMASIVTQPWLLRAETRTSGLGQ